MDEEIKEKLTKYYAISPRASWERPDQWEEQLKRKNGLRDEIILGLNREFAGKEVVYSFVREGRENREGHPTFDAEFIEEVVPDSRFFSEINGRRLTDMVASDDFPFPDESQRPSTLYVFRTFSREEGIRGEVQKHELVANDDPFCAYYSIHRPGLRLAYLVGEFDLSNNLTLSIRGKDLKLD